MKEAGAVAEEIEITNQAVTSTQGGTVQNGVDPASISIPVGDKLEVKRKALRQRSQQLQFQKLKLSMQKIRLKNRSHSSRFFKTVSDLFSINKGLHSVQASVGSKKPKNYAQQQVLLFTAASFTIHICSMQVSIYIIKNVAAILAPLIPISA